MKPTQLIPNKRKMIARFRSEYFRQFGVVISIKEEKIKPVVNRDNVGIENLEYMMLDFMPDDTRGLNETFITTCRRREFVELRMIYCKILRNLGYSLIEIGKKLGRDHSTIIYNINAANDLLQSSPKFLDLYGRIMHAIRAHIKINESNGKTIAIVPKAPNYPKSNHAATAHKTKDKGWKRSTSTKHRSTNSYKKGLSQYRLPTFTPSGKDTY